MAGSDKSSNTKSSGKPQDGEDDTVGVEFEDIDLNVTDEQIMDAVEELIDAMWDKAKSLINNSNFLFDGSEDSHRSTPGWPKQEKYLEETQAIIRSRFEEALTPKPSAFDDLIDVTGQVATTLGSADVSEYEEGEDLVRIGGDDAFDLEVASTSYLTHWEGSFKTAVVENYLTPFPGIVATQGSLAEALRGSARLLKLIFQRRRSDAAKLAKQATAAVEAIETDSEASAFTILGIVGAAIPMLGGATSALVGASASITSAIGGSMAGEEKELPLGAKHIEGVVDNMFVALDESDTTMQEDEERVINLLQTLEIYVAPLAGYPDGKRNELIHMTPELDSKEKVTDQLNPFG